MKEETQIINELYFLKGVFIYEHERSNENNNKGDC